jgi:gliding motility-associated-like protein
MIQHLRFAITISLFTSICVTANGQYEWLATLNYSNVTINRIGNIPGVTWIALVNSAYDQNNQRYFFLGNANRIPPWNLYTINAVTGTTINNPVCSSGVIGLQYDNGVDTLYAINLGSGMASLAWIDPVTGIAHNKSILPNYFGYNWSTYDSRDHWYITNNNALGMFVIDAFTGNIIYNTSSTLGQVQDIIYDNLNGRLYGVDAMNSQLDSITLSTGDLHVISNFPPMSQTNSGTFTIDEAAGKFIVVGSDAGAVQCFSNYLYVLDLNTGAVLSKSPYPYLQGPTILTDENLIEYSFDNKRGILYALNWHPPGNPLTTLTIYSIPNPACPGTPIQFVASPDDGTVNPYYQWQVNGKNVGTNSEVYTYETPVFGDSVRCIMSYQGVCTGPGTDTSFSIAVQSSSQFQNPASIQITDSSDTVCLNGQATFYAHTFNSGGSAIFQWIVNGLSVGNTDSVFVTSSLVNDDIVQCTVSVSSGCSISTTDSSNAIKMNVHAVYPSVTISGSKTEVCSGDPVVFTAIPLNGGVSPAFQWEINGITVAGADSNIFVSTSLKNNDTVISIMTGSVTCSVAAVSNVIVTTVNPVPVLFVGDDTIIAPNQTLRLQPVANAEVISYLWTPGIYLDNPMIADPVFTPGVTTAYQLLVTANDGCSTSGKITIVVYHPLKMPNAFTPNGDGIDDVFRIPPQIALNINSFSVFNRWGQRIFYTNNSGIGWDGTLDGQKQPEGAYVWMIQYTDALTKRFETTSGTVILIR